MIAQILQIHFINKIIQIRNNFKPPHMDPIYLLKRLIVKPLSQLKLKEITLEETKKIIKAMKASNTVGFDRISSKVLKLSLDLSAVLLTHAINVSIRTSTFPEALKVARVLPILKSNKNALDKMNYRPILNLHSAEKVLEEYIKKQLTEYLHINQIIHPNHHGGIRNRSTLTVKSLIEWQINKGYENNKTCMILSTDLSAAYDTVDHCILLRKMQFYGIVGKELEFFKSYLSNRTQFVELDT